MNDSRQNPGDLPVSSRTENERDSDPNPAEPRYDQIISDVAEPIIAAELRKNFHVTLSPEDLSEVNQDALELASEVRLRVLARVRSAGTDDIDYLRAYIRAVASNAFKDYLRKKYPARLRLSNRLRYIFSNSDGLASWHTVEGDFLCGIAGQEGQSSAPGDFDGDGKADPAVFRPSSGTWYVLRSSDSGVSAIPFGVDGDRPTVADFDGDGTDDISVFRPSVSQWWQLRSTEGVKAYGFGASGDRTAVADWTGDGKADIAFYRPASSEFYVIRSEDESFYAFPWGAAGDIPVPGDYDGDGTADAAVWRSADATWYILGSTSGFMAIPFGAGGDVPLPSVSSVQ